MKNFVIVFLLLSVGCSSDSSGIFGGGFNDSFEYDAHIIEGLSRAVACRFDVDYNEIDFQVYCDTTMYFNKSRTECVVAFCNFTPEHKHLPEVLIFETAVAKKIDDQWGYFLQESSSVPIETPVDRGNLREMMKETSERLLNLVIRGCQTRLDEGDSFFRGPVEATMDWELKILQRDSKKSKSQEELRKCIFPETN